MRVAEHAAAQQLDVGVELAGGVESAARVVEVHLVVGVEAAVLLPPQRGEAAVGIELGEARREGPLGGIRGASQPVRAELDVEGGIEGGGASCTTVTAQR